MSLRIDENHSHLFNAALSLNVKPENCESGQEPRTSNEETSGEIPSPEASNNFDLDAQQKAFQRFTNSIDTGFGGFRAPFNLNILPPFLAAALQQNPLTLQQQLLGLTSGMSGVSPSPDEEDENDNSGTTEPEDLTMVFRKESKLDDHTGENATNMSGPTWSYEEQFKQLYELSDDVKRKEWLDDWLSFMHRIGKPVTRIPIMAKQVLDLYELYRLVVQHGGLVEIINKKLWREITKGLNLPSSITSAAFTLRTQYQKYLYDYECEKEGLSNPSDLQAAIDGNRREGRRTTAAPSFGGLGYPMPHPGAATNLLNKHLNGLAMRNDFLDEENSLGMVPHHNLLAAYRNEQLAMFEAHQRQMEKAQRSAAETLARQSLGVVQSGRESTSSIDSEIPAKRCRLQADEQGGNSAGQMKITTRKPEGRQSDNSMVVSMEINGITYQGVLFALESDTNKTNSSEV